MRISVFAVFKSVILIVLLAGLGIGAYATYTYVPAMFEQLLDSSKQGSVAPGQDAIVKIPRGVSLGQVATLLEKEGVISNRLVFKLVAMIRGEQRKIQAGDYELKTGSDAGEVLDQLISGKTLMFSFTVPEGYTVFQTADLFHKSGTMSGEDFLRLVRDPAFLKELGVTSDSLEGYLFPDTYFLRASERKDGKSLIRRMVGRFREVYDKHVRARAEEFGWSVNQVVTLASLIEKEARASEHPLVSAVFHNRLRKRMRLQCDPTVIYGIKPMGSKITKADLKRKHAYNTYQISGLPPGPIASPGKASLIAAIRPANEDYLYFVARNDGTHLFSKSLKDHNRGVNRYQRAAGKKKR